MERITFDEFKKYIYKFQEKDLYIHIDSSIRTMIMIDKCILYIKNDVLYIKSSFPDDDGTFDVEIDLNMVSNFYKLKYDSNLKLNFDENMEVIFDFDKNS